MILVKLFVVFLPLLVLQNKLLILSAIVERFYINWFLTNRQM